MEKTILRKYEITEQNQYVIDVPVNIALSVLRPVPRSESLQRRTEESGMQNDSSTQNETDQEFVDYIIDCVKDIGDSNFIIRLTFSDFTDEMKMNHARSSIGTTFLCLKDVENHSIDAMLSRSYKAFGFATFLLAFVIIINRYFLVNAGAPAQLFFDVLTIAAGVLLIAVVANIFIKWQSHAQNINLYDRIIKAPIVFRHSQAKEKLIENQTFPKS